MKLLFFVLTLFFASLVSGAESAYTLGETVVVKSAAQTSNGTVTLPPGFNISQVVIQNTTANAVTGGIRIGTTDGGVDIVLALAVGANALTAVADAALLKRLFSTSTTQTLYIQAVVGWNSANINVWIIGSVLP